MVDKRRDTTKRLNAEIDKDIYNQFKGKCYANGENITIVIEKLIKDYLERSNKHKEN